MCVLLIVVFVGLCDENIYQSQIFFNIPQTNLNNKNFQPDLCGV